MPKTKKHEQLKWHHHLRNHISYVAKHIWGVHLYAFGLLRKLYDWVISWADTPYGVTALFILAFIESSFFPIPPDVLLIALCLSANKKSFKFAAICTAGSVLGGLLGYLIGYSLYELIGAKIIAALNYQSYFDAVGRIYNENSFLAIFGAAFTPIPYKVFTIAAGVWKINIFTMIVASLTGRAMRFFLVAGMLYFFGERMKKFIDKYFNWLSLAFFVLLVVGFIILKYIL